MPIGEVIETSSSKCVAQSYVLEQAPALGSLVQIGTSYGVVAEIRTVSLDPSRKPQALGDGKKKLAEIFQEQPQLQALLRTEFEIQLVAIEALPDSPPRLHEQVTEASAQALVKDLSYLRYLKDLPSEVLVKHVRLLAGTEEVLKISATRILAHYLKNDAEKLEEVLERLA